MTIEVTEKTFFKLFSHTPVVTKEKESYQVSYYDNEEIQQRGQQIWNYASSKKHQYYLTDINA